MRVNPLFAATGAVLAALAVATVPVPGLQSAAEAQVAINGQRVFEGQRVPRPQNRTADPRLRAQPLNIFEAMFPNLIEERLRRERELNPPVEVEKVSAPKYYAYKADPLVKVNLAALVPAVEATAAPAVAGPDALDDGADVMRPPAEAQDPARAAFERVAVRFGGITVMAEAPVAKVVVAHYAEKGEVLWLDGELRPNARARSVQAVLDDAGRFGLDSADYRVEPPQHSDAADLAEADAARFEIEMTARVLRYALDAAGGRVDPNRISGYHDFPQRGVTPEAALTRLLAGGLPARVLTGFHPDNAPFRALTAELERLSREADTAEIVTIPADILIKPGDTHAEIPNVVAAIKRKGSDQLTTEHAAALAAATGNLYSPELVVAVKAFQKEQGLGVDGVIGRNTVSRLTDVSLEDKRRRVVLALERLRWHPHDLGATRVVINQPAFRAYFVRNDRTELDMRVIVGKTTNQTSFFHDVIETVEYNPYWGIPRSILVNEYLPKLRENPAYLDERGYEVTDARGRRIPSSAIDWWQVGSNPQFDVRQLPGEANALGELKILFPNKHAIYMHDTPTKPLFERDVRAFSHGCVRLAQPREMAAAVLGTTVDHIAGKLKQGHGSEDVTTRIPVYVAYFTAWPDDGGRVGYHADIYGRDDKLAKAIEATAGVRHPTS
ncbi:MAG: L,D-transpeptidase [Alphaproteobacteria bacterium]|nr:MAG: L,D-transpeptidase [Alphaproteobacteria bacterium]